MAIKTVGIMSGSSLDGIDVVYATFDQAGKNKWSFSIDKAIATPFPEQLEEKLKRSRYLASEALLELEYEFGFWLASELKKNYIDNYRPTFISTHGHTIFHNPTKHYSYQLSGAHQLCAQLGLPVIFDFRMPDIARGGQGAPLVPAGEVALFAEHEAFLNLGGIANISFVKKGIRAWDVVPFNQVLNALSIKRGHAYDAGGTIARKGSILPDWYQRWQAIEYFQRLPPKSISNEWVAEHFLSDLPEPEDGLHTYCHFAADQIAETLNQSDHLDASSTVLVTGGGALNHFFVELLAEKSRPKIVVPTPEIIEYKEALIFAFLGLLRWYGQTNVLKSVTGATKDSTAGTIILP